MRCKLGCALSTFLLGLGLVGAASASAEGASNGQGKNCHAVVLQQGKALAGTNSTAATAAALGSTFGFTGVRGGQEFVSQVCGKS